MDNMPITRRIKDYNGWNYGTCGLTHEELMERFGAISKRIDEIDSVCTVTKSFLWWTWQKIDYQKALDMMEECRLDANLLWVSRNHGY